MSATKTYPACTFKECDYLNGWIKKNGHIRKNLSQNGEPQRYSWGRQKKKKKRKKNKKNSDYKRSALVQDMLSRVA